MVGKGCILKVDHRLRNAPAAPSDTTTLIFAEFAEVKAELVKAHQQLADLGDKATGRFDRLDNRTRRILIRTDKTYTDLIQIFTDEAKECPRLFSLVPFDLSIFKTKQLIFTLAGKNKKSLQFSSVILYYYACR